MDLGIRGKKALVNGGSAGMGRGSALALAVEGVELYISSRGAERLNKTCDEIARTTGASVTPIVADHSTDQGREKILAACPNPDILVHTCSPPPRTGDFRDVTMEDWQKTLELTLLSPVQFINALVDGMIERGWGRIVNIGTGAAKFPAEIRVLSGPPRAALVNYSVAVARKVARHNVIINNILPGMYHSAATKTRYTALAEKNGTSYDEEIQKFIDEWRIASNQFGNPEDLGAFVAMFCSQQANNLVGQSLVMDGGVNGSTF